METLKERDSKLEVLWGQLEDVPMNSDTETIKADFLHFSCGTKREDIWKWFDERHSKGIRYLLYGETAEQTGSVAEYLLYKDMCVECLSECCTYNPEGICRFPLVYGRPPELHDDGCRDWVSAD